MNYRQSRGKKVSLVDNFFFSHKLKETDCITEKWRIIDDVYFNKQFLNVIIFFRNMMFWLQGKSSINFWSNTFINNITVENVKIETDIDIN